jgi:hypothetical protein
MLRIVIILFALFATRFVLSQTPNCLFILGDDIVLGSGLAYPDQSTFWAVLAEQYGYTVYQQGVVGSLLLNYFQPLANSAYGNYTIANQTEFCDVWVISANNDVLTGGDRGSASPVGSYYYQVPALAAYLSLRAYCGSYTLSGRLFQGWCGNLTSLNSSLPGTDGAIATVGFSSFEALPGQPWFCASTSGTVGVNFTNIPTRYFAFSVVEQYGYTTLSTGSTFRAYVYDNANSSRSRTWLMQYSPTNSNATLYVHHLYIIDLEKSTNSSVYISWNTAIFCFGYYAYFNPGGPMTNVKLLSPLIFRVPTLAGNIYSYLELVMDDTANYLSGFGLPVQHVRNLGHLDENSWFTGNNNLTCHGHSAIAYIIAKHYDPSANRPYSVCSQFFLSPKKMNKLQHALNGNINPGTGTKKGRQMGPRTKKQHKRAQKRGRRNFRRKAKKQGHGAGFIGPLLPSRGRPRRQRKGKGKAPIAEVKKDVAQEDAVAKKWVKVINDPLTGGDPKLGDVAVATNPGFLSSRVMNYGYQAGVSAPYHLYLITCSDIIANAEGITGNQGLTIYGWQTTASTSPEFTATFGYSNGDFLKTMSGACRTSGISFKVKVQQPSTATPGEIYGGVIPTDGGFAEMAAYINSLSASQVQNLPGLTRIAGSGASGSWRPLDEDNLKFSENTMNYDPSLPPTLLPGGQFACVLLSGWAWYNAASGETASNTANFDIDCQQTLEMIPVREAAALVPPQFTPPKTPHDLSAIFSKVISRLGSSAVQTLKESARSTVGEGMGMLGGLFGMSNSHGLKGMKFLKDHHKPKVNKDLYTIYKNLGAPGYHPKTGFNMQHAFSRYLHNTSIFISDDEMVPIRPPIPAPIAQPIVQPQPLKSLTQVSEPPTPNGEYVKVMPGTHRSYGIWGPAT